MRIGMTLPSWAKTKSFVPGGSTTERSADARRLKEISTVAIARSAVECPPGFGVQSRPVGTALYGLSSATTHKAVPTGRDRTPGRWRANREPVELEGRS